MKKENSRKTERKWIIQNKKLKDNITFKEQSNKFQGYSRKLFIFQVCVEPILTAMLFLFFTINIFVLTKTYDRIISIFLALLLLFFTIRDIRNILLRKWTRFFFIYY